MIEKTAVDPCVLISAKFYLESEELSCNDEHCSAEKESGIDEIKNKPKNFDYGSYIIQSQSRKEKEIEALGGVIANNPSLDEVVKTVDDNVVVVKTGWRRYIGLVLALIATMSYSLATLIVKMCDDIHPFTLSFWRFQGILIPAIPLLLYSRFVAKKPVFETIWPATTPDKWKMIMILTVRSIIGCSSTICHLSALQYINMADASVIAFSCPVFVTLFAHLCLGEKCGFVPLMISLLTLCGVTIITRPPLLAGGQEFDTNTLIGTGLAFSSMVSASFVIIFLRYLRGTHFSFMMITYGLIGTIECVIISHFHDVLHFPSTTKDWIYCGLLVTLTFVSQICLTSALKYEEASPVSLIQSTDCIFAFIWQFMFLSTIPDAFSLTGSSIVVFGVLITTFRKWLLTLPDENASKKRFKMILM